MNAIDNVLNLQMCSSCGETPCVASNYIQIAQDYKSNHAKDNKSTHYFAYQKYIRDTYGILGKGQRVKLPHCVECVVTIFEINWLSILGGNYYSNMRLKHNNLRGKLSLMCYLIKFFLLRPFCSKFQFLSQEILVKLISIVTFWITLPSK